jgi:hypothetical protein
MKKFIFWYNQTLGKCKGVYYPYGTEPNNEKIEPIIFETEKHLAHYISEIISKEEGIKKEERTKIMSKLPEFYPTGNIFISDNPQEIRFEIERAFNAKELGELEFIIKSLLSTKNNL